jgi:hypothetical protein
MLVQDAWLTLKSRDRCGQLTSGINHKLCQEDPPWESEMRKLPLVLGIYERLI